MRPRRLRSIALAGLVAAGLGGALAWAGSASAHSPVGSARSPVGTVGGVGIFTESCRYSHSAGADPILMPGMTGMSMQHDFFGNTTTNASSTAATLAAGPTTCSTSADASAYWAPALYQNRTRLTPLRSVIYWRVSGPAAASVHTMPAGLSMIAGDESATTPQGRRRVSWTCTGADGTGPRVHTDVPHGCAAGASLKVTIAFPSCWDGTTLNGATQRNVVYPSRRACPAGHPVRIPELVFHAIYPTSSAAGLTLSTGPDSTGSINSEHADFLNAFAPAPLGRDVSSCLVGRVRCGHVRGPEATPASARRGNARAGQHRGHGQAS